jgi:tRNA 2-selenouridine synthase
MMSSSSAPITPVTGDNFKISSHKYSAILDVRSPSEFEDDHIPSAINLPVLSEEERIQVGTMYKGQPFHARRVGAALVSRNIASMLEKFFHDKDPRTFTPLIYCWRGGQRSKSISHILSEVGFRCYFLEGGYKTYRKSVVQMLQETPSQLKFTLLGGHTGAGKTVVLERMRRSGHQVIDLEDLSNHRGSLLGHTDGVRKLAQPTQKMFETRLTNALSSVDPNRTVWLEAESNKIGNVQVPNVLWSAMKAAPRINLRVPVRERVRHTMATYQYWMDPLNREELLADVVGRLNAVQGNEWCDVMCRLIHEQKFDEFVERMLRDHYDVLYSANEKRIGGNVLGEIFAESVAADDIDRVVLPQIEQLGNLR